MTARSAARLKPPRHAAVGATVAGLADGIATPAHAEAVWFREYSAEKTRNGHKIALAVYRKRLGAPHPGEPARPGTVPCARLVNVRSDQLRPGGARTSRILDHGHVRPLWVRRLDDGP